MTRELIEVISAGPLATIQDAGRHGFAHFGVPSSGAADGASFRLANRLVGNPEDHPAIETTFGGLVVRSLGWNRVCVTGADAKVEVGTRVEATNCVLLLSPGDTLAISPPARGLRNYLAVAGLLDVPRTFGSASSDLLGGLGPRPLAPGDRLSVVDGSVPPPAPIDFAVVPPLGDSVVLRFAWGPRDDLFSEAAVRTFVGEGYAVDVASNRVGVRLTGPRLERRNDADIPSEPMLPGSIEVPADGLPIVLLRDHPTTGGYPVIGVVHPLDLDLLAQCRPGTRVRFRPAAPLDFR